MKISLLPAGTTPTGVEAIPAVQGGQTVTLTATQIAGAVADDVITNAKAANMAQSTIKGRAASAGTGDPTDLTAAQVKTILGLATTSTDNAVTRFDGAAGGTQNSGITIDDNNLISGVRLNLLKATPSTLPTVISGTVPAFNQTTISGENLDSSAGLALDAHQIYYTFGGTTVQGGRNGLNIFVANTAATSASNANRNYVGMNTFVEAVTGDGGTGTGAETAKGSWFGTTNYVWLTPGCQNAYDIAAVFGSSVIDAAATVRYARGAAIIGAHAARGVAADAGLTFQGSTVAGASHIGWKHGILFSDMGAGSLNPFYSGSTVMGTFWETISVPTIDLGIDFGDGSSTGVLFTSFAFRSKGFTVSGAGAIRSASSIKSTSTTGGIGYAVGAGGTVTQATDKTTGVTLDRSCGEIVMNAAALNAATIVSFTLTSTAIAATDVLVLNHVTTGTRGAYTLEAECAAGSATIYVRNNTAGNLSEAIVIRYAKISGVVT